MIIHHTYITFLGSDIEPGEVTAVLCASTFSVNINLPQVFTSAATQAPLFYAPLQDQLGRTQTGSAWINRSKLVVHCTLPQSRCLRQSVMHSCNIETH